MSDEEEREYEQLVLRTIARFAPKCSDYQIWRALFGLPLDLKYPKQVNVTLAKLQNAGYIDVDILQGLKDNGCYDTSIVTVMSQPFELSSVASGRPTMWLRPSTTACLPLSGIS